MNSQVIFQIQNGLILALLYTGVAFRRQRALHVKLMASAIFWDILLILQIELARHAIGKAVQVPTNPALLNFHVAIAVTTVLLYGAMFYSGRQLLQGRADVRPRHKWTGVVTLILRTLTFITSFMVVNHSSAV